jgi:hypothetical protein
MKTTKLGFNVLQIVDIPRDYLRRDVLRQLSGCEQYQDVDSDFEEGIYLGNVFEEIALSHLKCIELKLPIVLDDEDLQQINSIANDVKEFELIRVSSI